MGRGTRIGKERKRADVAKALVAGELPSRIAPKLGCSTAYVGELATTEREAQNLARRFLSPHHARLAKATELREHEQLRNELKDFAQAMRGVERLDPVELAQGGKRENGAAAGGLTPITVAQVLQLISSEAGAR
jgi:hypothetical protein